MDYFNDNGEDLLGTILVVDDERAIQNLLLNWLEPSGFTVEIANNGKEALEKAAQVRPSAIVMDASMPIMSGFEALAEFKRRPDLASIPVMMLTVHYEVRDIVNALDMGAADYMQKPFNPQVLMARLRAIIRLRDTMKRLALTSSNGAPLISLDHSGIILAATPAACEGLGRSQDALIGANITDILPWLDVYPWTDGSNFSKCFREVPINSETPHLYDCLVTGIPAGECYTLSIVHC